MTSAIDLDPIATTLRSFLDTHLGDIAAEEAKVRSQVLRPVRQMRTGRQSRTSAFAAIRSCTMLAQKALRQACSSHSIDFWLACVRRLPTVLTDWPEEWLSYATLALLKWSNWTENTTVGAYWAGRTSAIVFSLTEDDLLSCFRIASLARVLAESNNTCRWLGKGAAVAHIGDGMLALDIPPDIRVAVAEYERRRPEASLLADEGILVDRTLPDIESFVEAPLIALGTPRPPLDRAILKQTGEAYAINYYPIPRSKRTLLRVLGPYDEALEDLFGTGAKTIADVLQSASTLILRSIPVPDEPEEALAFDATLGDGDFANSFSFMLSLCRKGFVRLPEQHLRERLTQE
jgi:hypothetical protein